MLRAASAALLLAQNDVKPDLKKDVDISEVQVSSPLAYYDALSVSVAASGNIASHCFSSARTRSQEARP